jgi:ribonuclease HII
MLAMRRAIEGLRVVTPLEALIDGNRMPTGLAMPARAIVGGDALEQAISAASILAKTDRDHEMLRLAAAVSAVRHCAAQGLSDAGTSCGLAQARSIAHPPPQLCAGGAVAAGLR